MFGWLKPRIDAKRRFKSERVDTCLLAHTIPLAFLLLPPSSFFADTCFARTYYHELAPFLPLPLHASPSHSLHPHRPSSRRGRAAVEGGQGCHHRHLISIPRGAPLPSSPTSTHSSTHPPPTPPPSPLFHSHTRFPLFVHPSQSFVRCAVSACVASIIVGSARSGVVAMCDKSFFKITEKVKRDCRRTPHFHCVCFV